MNQISIDPFQPVQGITINQALSHIPTPTAIRFAAYHKTHPRIWQLLEKEALAQIKAGETRLGFRQMAENMRKGKGLVKIDGEPFVVHNDMIPYFGELFCAKYVQLAQYVPRKEKKGFKEAACT